MMMKINSQYSLCRWIPSEGVWDDDAPFGYAMDQGNNEGCESERK
jgi:hypothetical protein